MMESPLEPTDPYARTQNAAATYRCVCGEMIPLDTAGDSCPGCGRHYDSDIIRDAAAETLFMPADLEGSDGTGNRGDDLNEALLGQRLGHFRIIEHLGGGGMGTVYRALDESLQRYVALKVMRPNGMAGDKTEVQRLFQEARAQARVNHPNVAHIYFVGTDDDDAPFLAMELVGKYTLTQRLKYGPLSFPDVARIALQLASALQHAAKFDIVHGDVKPSNVLLVDAQNVKLSDFGLARRLSEMNGTPGTAVGTPNYMAPELSRGKSANHSSDMYSLGVTLFEMTFGRLPYDFADSDVPSRLRMHRESAIAFPEQWPQEIPRAWKKVLRRLLAKQPDERYADYAELIDDLKNYQPVSLPTARPLLRGLALIFDLFILSSLVMLVQMAMQYSGGILPQIVGTILQTVIPLGGSYLQMRWGTTPGKRLFQIRIVDENNLTPGKTVLATRAAFQFLVVWASVASNLMLNLGIPHAHDVLRAAGIAFFLTDAGFALFNKGRSLHDRMFRTRVVLDAAPSG